MNFNSALFLLLASLCALVQPAIAVDGELKVTADGKGKVQTMNVSRIVDPRSPETKLPEVQLPQAYLDVARAKSEASLQNPTRRGSIESVSCFSFTPEQPTVVITDLNRPLDRQP